MNNYETVYRDDHGLEIQCILIDDAEGESYNALVKIRDWSFIVDGSDIDIWLNNIRLALATWRKMQGLYEEGEDQNTESKLSWPPMIDEKNAPEPPTEPAPTTTTEYETEWSNAMLKGADGYEAPQQL